MLPAQLAQRICGQCAVTLEEAQERGDSAPVSAHAAAAVALLERDEESAQGCSVDLGNIGELVRGVQPGAEVG